MATHRTMLHNIPLENSNTVNNYQPSSVLDNRFYNVSKSIASSQLGHKKSIIFCGQQVVQFIKILDDNNYCGIKTIKYVSIKVVQKPRHPINGHFRLNFGSYIDVTNITMSSTSLSPDEPIKN